jgi:hypothetical protein
MSAAYLIFAAAVTLAVTFVLSIHQWIKHEEDLLKH